MSTTKKTGKLTAFSVAAAYIGAIVGVSFSSGQELLTYFGNFGKLGMIGCCISFTLFAIFGPICLITARRLKRNRYDYVTAPFPEKRGWRIWRYFNFYCRMFFMFGAIASMAAGCANILSTRFGIPYYVGAFLMLGAGLFFAIGSQKRFVGALSFATPLMVVIGIILCSIAAIKPPVEPSTWDAVSSDNALIGGWGRSAFLYFGYNISLSISVLSPMAEDVKDDKNCIWAGIITGIVNGGFALICVYALIRNYSIASVVDMPTIEIAFAMNKFAGYAYCIVALLAIFTTLVGILNVFRTRLQDLPFLNKESTKSWLNIQTFVIFLALLSYGLSFVGFKKLTGYFFPFSGYCAITFIVGLLFNFFWSFKHRVDRPEVKKDNT